MISEAEFMKLPKCEKCKNRGKYSVRCDTVELQDDYGVEPGMVVNIKCSRCELQRIRRKMFLDNSTFDKTLLMYQLSDYVYPDKTTEINLKLTEEALSIAKNICSDIENNFINEGGFTLIYDKNHVGKSILAYIILRESYCQGFSGKIISIADLTLILSQKIYGNVVLDHDGDVIFDLEDYINCDVLIIDEFELINEYFGSTNIRRAFILKIFRDRLKNGKPTIVLSQSKLKVLFSEANLGILGVPFDFPSIILRNYRIMSLHGKFKKEKTKIK